MEGGSLTARSAAVLDVFGLELLRAQVIERIFRDVVLSDLEMKVRRGRVAGAADLGDGVALSDGVAFLHFVLSVVRVDGGEIAAVAHDDEVAVAAELVRIDDLPALDDAHRRPFGGGDVDAVVNALAARAEAGGDDAGDR